MQSLGFFRSMGGEYMKTKYAFIAAHASGGTAHTAE